ncbi:hypothetical protein V6N13_006035 [Hibiscus sabdariffa]
MFIYEFSKNNLSERVEANDRALEDVRSMGFDLEDFEGGVEMIPSDGDGQSWAEKVDMLNNPETLRDVIFVGDLEDKFEDTSFFPEFSNRWCKKKYASFFDL